MECAGRAGAATALSDGRETFVMRKISCVRKRGRAALAPAVQDIVAAKLDAVTALAATGSLPESLRTATK